VRKCLLIPQVVYGIPNRILYHGDVLSAIQHRNGFCLSFDIDGTGKGKLSSTLTAFFRIKEYNSIRTTGYPYTCCRSIFEYVDRFDIPRGAGNNTDQILVVVRRVVKVT